jgi:hypothetical protein
VSAVAGVVLDRIGALLQTGQQYDLSRAVGMATAAAQMDYGNRGATLRAVLSAPAPIASRHGLLTVLIFAGEIIPVAFSQQGFDDALAKYVAQQWHGQNEWWVIEQWLELMAFSDSPEAIIPCVERLPNEFKRVHNFDRIVYALGHIDPVQSLKTLTGLAGQVTGLAETHDYISAIAKIGSADAARHLTSLAMQPATKRPSPPREPDVLSCRERVQG